VSSDPGRFIPRERAPCIRSRSGCCLDKISSLCVTEPRLSSVPVCSLVTKLTELSQLLISAVKLSKDPLFCTEAAAQHLVQYQGRALLFFGNFLHLELIFLYMQRKTYVKLKRSNVRRLEYITHQPELDLFIILHN
jgi:hypothetical protein